MFDSYINQCQELMVPVDLILAGNQGNHQINFVPSLISIQEALILLSIGKNEKKGPIWLIQKN